MSSIALLVKAFENAQTAPEPAHPPLQGHKQQVHLVATDRGLTQIHGERFRSCGRREHRGPDEGERRAVDQTVDRQRDSLLHRLVRDPHLR
jgi:hypothetical protein